MASPPPVPALPPRAKARGSAAVPGPLDNSLSPTSTFYIDLERDAVVSMGPVARPVSYGMFPEDVMDPDQPITRSQRTGKFKFKDVSGVLSGLQASCDCRPPNDRDVSPRPSDACTQLTGVTAGNFIQTLRWPAVREAPSYCSSTVTPTMSSAA